MKLFGSSHNGGAHTKAAHSAAREEREILVSEIRSDPPAKAAADAPKSPAPAGKTKGKKNTVRRVLLIIAAVILAFLAFTAIHFLVAGHFFWESPLEVPGPSTSGNSGIKPPVNSQRPGQGPEGSEDGPPESEPPENGDDDDEDALHITAGSPRKDGVFTFLLAGIDYFSSSTDTIMVVSFDTKQHTLSCTSIPRDTLVNISWSNTPKKINAVLPGYNNSGKDGVEGLKEHVRNVLGFEVDYYVMVSLEAVEHAVDAVGGVWFDVPQDMKYYAPDEGLDINIKKGYQLLDGENALKLCRFRSDYAGGDLQRIEMQHEFLSEMASQVIKNISITNIGSLAEILTKDVDTDLTTGNVAWLGRQFLSCKSEDITFQTAPNYASGINDISFVGLLVNDWLDMVNDSINPYEDDVTTANLNILTFNYGGAGIGSTTGTIAGGYDSFYCITCTVKNGGGAIHHAPGAHLSFSAPAPAGTGEGGGEGAE